MGQVVTFDYTEWLAIYPMFNVAPTVTTEVQAQAYFDQATLFLANDGSGPVNDPVRLKSLLYMLTAHIAALSNGYGGNAPSGFVGRVSSASEGSVSVSAEFMGTVNSAWYLQTPWGALYWQLTASLRQMRYVRGPTRFGSGRSTGFGPGFRRF